MYTNEQRLSYAKLMKDVNSEQFERKGTENWAPVSLTSHRSDSAQEIQLYENHGEYVFSIQDMDLIEDFELDDLNSLDSVSDAKVMAYIQAGEFPSEFVKSIEFVYQAMNELNIDPEKVTFVGAGIGGAHAQMLAHTFGGNLFTHDAPPVAKMLDGIALTPGATYQTTLDRMQLNPPGPKLAENIVERGSAVSENNSIFTHEDYIGSVKEIDSVSNVLPVISKASEKIASLLDDKSSKKNKSDDAQQGIKGHSITSSSVSKSVLKKVPYVRLGEAAAQAVSYGTAIYDTAREGGSHDVDVFINYLSDVSKSNEHIEELVMQAYQIYGMPVDENIEFELAQLATDIFDQQESLAFFSHDQMVDTIEYQLSKIMIEQGLNQDLIKERPVHDVVNFLEMPVNYALAKLDQLSDSSSIVAYLEQKMLGEEIKPNFESYAVVKLFDDFLRREFGSDVSELNQALVEAANTVDYYLDEMADATEQAMLGVGQGIQAGVEGFSNLVGQVYNQFERYVETQVLQLQETAQLNFDAIASQMKNVAPMLLEQSQVIFEIDDFLENYYQALTEQISELPTVNQLYTIVSDSVTKWSELEIHFTKPITSSIELEQFNQQLKMLSGDVTSTQTLLEEMRQHVTDGEALEAPHNASNNAELIQMLNTLSDKLSTMNDDILTLQTTLGDAVKPTTVQSQNHSESQSQSLDNNRASATHDFRP